MQTLRLRAGDERALISALPMLRVTDPDDGERWLTICHACYVDPIGPLVLTPSLIDPASGQEVAPAVVDARWHLNIIGPRAGADPEAWAAIVVAAAPYTLAEIAAPRRGWQL
ncbi:hypothetical protein F1643_18215 [Azospirillum sp. INR13]|uniref:hypothetical protein n=1 Tax=Azospirillum sp. INR13 TaxID=2596919 RepID=UPI00189241E4|nr:hypothetical protein [Azospirillum sp. INR13]MBF5096026.1 hypothetical protein [Azospirillum sp. INR13]